MRLTLLACLAAPCLAATCLATSPALAWKPTTHGYLADLATQDALDDGKLTFTNLANGKVMTYPVDPQALDALRTAQPYYRAGVLGPDAYPDILTGQQVIHPVAGESGVSGGSNAWLQQVWDGFGTTPQQRAFRLGFLTHAAGDMYGHSFINYFTGGNFTLSPLDNAVRHVVLEGYIDKRLPAAALTGSLFTASISGIEPQIYQVMIRADAGSALDTQLLPEGPGSRLSVPRIYSTLRNRLDAEIRAYYQQKADLQRQIDNCKLTDFTCSKAALTVKLGAYVTANAIQTTYKEYWRDDIDDGLKAWPGVSHAVAVALFYNSDRQAKVSDAETLLTNYARDHLLSMSGAPDAVGLGAAAVASVIAAITPDFLLEPIRKLKADLLDAMLESAIGMNKTQLQQYLTTPDRYFDTVMNAAAGAGVKISLADFNANYLHIRDKAYADTSESFDVNNLPAAYDTVVMSKLILLAPATINQLLADLGSAQRLGSANVMLGFITSLDGSGQWRDGMVLVRDCAAYRQLLKALPGPGTCDGVPVEPIGAIVSFNGGSFVELGGGKWVEKDSTGKVVFNFTEAGRYPGEVKLWDADRRVHISLNFNGQMIWYAPDGSPLTPLYAMTSVK